MSIVADGISPLKDSRIVVADRHAHNRTALREMVSSLGASSVSHAQSAGGSQCFSTTAGANFRALGV